MGETRAKIVYLLSDGWMVGWLDGWMVQKFSSTLRNQVDPRPELREEKPSLRSEIETVFCNLLNMQVTQDIKTLVFEERMPEA